ncbi:hypothetical protein N431DRAFT_466744 [Stipitochalara longipes BDJ]|nr:hypothetical protein N431DRAFT_466744 [Stipitochalara longipes BDJ]
MPNSCLLANRQFIVSTGLKKTDPETRKLIRSHVMLGKNRRKNQNNHAGEIKLETAVAGSHDEAAWARRFLAAIPRKVGTDLSFTTFPDMIDPQAAAEALRYVVRMSRAKYVLESCLTFDDLGNFWNEQLAIDAPLLQTVIFMAQTYFDLVGGGNNSSLSQIHLKTLQLLRQKLSLGDKKSQLAEPTVFVIVNLAVHAHISGEHKSAQHHLEGIRRIVELRGGLNEFRQIKLLIELSRCDIGMALHTGTKPLFYPDDDHSRLSLPYPDEISFPCETNRVFDGLDDLDEEVAKAWQAMASFCSLINLAAEARGRIRWELFLNTMTSVMYRLIYMSFHVGSANEAIRLGLLALSSHIFLQWKVVTTTYDHLRASYRNCLDCLEVPDCIPSHLSSWLLMVGAVSVFNQPDAAWLGPRLRASVASSGIKSWNEMRDVLDSLMWIPLVQEKSGKDFFDSVFRSE